MTTEIPHFTFPFHLNHGSFAVVEQDSLDEIEQSVIVLLRTPVGSRLELDKYGAPESLFATAVDQSGIVAAVETWEPRARVLIKDDPNRFDEAVRAIRAKGNVSG